MRMSLWFTIAAVLMTLVACASAQYSQKAAEAEKRPGWIDNPGREYPSEMYITAVGSGASSDAAKNNALAGISRVFESDIKSQQDVMESYFESGTDEDLSLTQSLNLSEKTSITSEQSLKNIVIDKTWFSAAESRHYALAYIDRSRTASIYLKDIGKLDEESAGFFNMTENAESKMSKLAYLNAAVSKAVHRDVLMKQLTTLSLGQRTYTPIIPPSDMAAARRELTGRIRVALDLVDIGNLEIESAIREVIQSFGFSIVTSDPEFMVTGRFTIEKLKREGAFVRWFLDLHMSEIESQMEFLTYSNDGREGHTSFAEAERRAARTAKKKIKEDFYKKIDKYLSSLITKS